MIKLLILDVDGVLTDGRKYYGLDGMPFIKTFSDKDWTAIKRFKALGIPVIFITGDAKVNELVGKNRNIPVYLSRGMDKADLLPTIEERFKLHLDDMAYVGDDLFDISIMQEVKYSFCTNDSPDIVKKVCSVTLDKNGGDNVIMHLFDYCEVRGLIPRMSFKETMDAINELDKLEKF
jgi:3-deoxy-D-manno-octulosonate 8-phosphate phosphatase (KDO 8-P phosphatase)